MLEDDRGTLQTWALTEAPCLDRQIYADALPPHRTEYLDYEGPISGDRGEVTRWIEGTYTESERGHPLLQFTKDGVEHQWLLQLLFTDDATWCVFTEA